METGDVGGATKAWCWSFGRCEFDESRWELRVAGEPVELERKPAEVLQYLLRHAGEVVTKAELLGSVWAGRVVVEAVLTNAVGKVRKALEGSGQEIVATLPKVGYRLVVPVSRRMVEYLPEDSRLQAGDAVPRRQNWKLEAPLARTEGNEVWLARHAKTREVRVFKFSLSGRGLHGLKREVTIARLLHEALGERGDFVRVLDWDFDEAPYFVESEYGGVGLDRWPEGSEVSGVPLPLRLALFVEAADAVAAAHGLGVLHKDLKPANLLVYESEGAQHLRVADFGSSRLLDSGSLEALGITHLGLTQTQSMAFDSGTPLYLAPELVTGQSPTIKSDLYALGVTLYQLVVGDFRRPLAPGWEAEVADPLLREDIADAANGDPAGRLESAALLAERIRTLDKRREQRALDEAVRARIADGEKRLAKIRARRPWMAASMLLLVMGLGVTSWLLVKTWASERQAAEQRDLARALNQFVERDVLAAANPMQSGNSEITMRQALERAAPEIESRFAAQPDVAARLHATVGQAFHAISDYTAAQQHFHRAAELHARLSGPGSADAIDMRLHEANALARIGDTPQARKLLVDLPAQIDALGPEWRNRVRIHYDQISSWIAFQEGDFAASVPPLENAVGLLALLPEPDPALDLEVTQALTMARGLAGLPAADVVRMQEAALRKLQSTRTGQKTPWELSARYNLLRMRVLAGEERTLEHDYRKMIADLTDVLGPRNEATLLAMHGLSHIYYKQEKWSECRALARQAHAGLSELLGEGHMHVVNSANTYSACLLGEGEVEQAATVLRAALASIKDSEGKRIGLVRSAVQINLGHVLAEGGQWDELETLLADLNQSGAGLLRMSKDAAGEVALIEGRLAAARGDAAGAKERLEHGLELLSANNPPEYWLIRMGQRELQKVAGR